MTSSVTSPATSPSGGPVITAAVKFTDELFSMLGAGYSCFHLHTGEEMRAIGEITNVARQMAQKLRTKANSEAHAKWELAVKNSPNLPAPLREEKKNPEPMRVILWSAVDGFTYPRTPDNERKPPKCDLDEYAGADDRGRPNGGRYSDPALALDTVIGTLPGWEHAIVVFRDLDDYLGMPDIRRRLKTAVEQRLLANDTRNYRIIILSAAGVIHPKLHGIVTPISLPLPDEPEIADIFEFTRLSACEAAKEDIPCDPALKELLVPALLGLTSFEVENVLALAMGKFHNTYCPEMLEVVKDAKATIIRSSQVLTYVRENKICKADQLGGFEALIEWLHRRRGAYSKEARSVNLDLPKGIVLLGCPGSGKSMAGMAASLIMNMPLYILDVGAIFGSLVGESEARLRHAIRQVEAQQGCVLLIDEADKGFGDAHNAGGDSGTTRRVFGQLLSWLANKTDRTFVIMTMNRTTGIPPELLRAGRFDSVWYTDLPDEAERRKITEIHLQKRGIPTETYAGDDWSMFLAKTNDYVGSELEQIVVEARAAAFERSQQTATPTATPTMAELVQCVTNVTPLSRLDKEGLNAIREFVQDRARPVNGRRAGDMPASPAPGTRRRLTTAKPSQNQQNAGNN